LVIAVNCSGGHSLRLRAIALALREPPLLDSVATITFCSETDRTGSSIGQAPQVPVVAVVAAALSVCLAKSVQGFRSSGRPGYPDSARGSLISSARRLRDPARTPADGMCR